MTIPMSCQSEGALQLYIEPVLVAPEVLIVGRSPMVATLLELVRGVGWRGEIVDGLDFQPHMAGPGSIVIVGTQGHGAGSYTHLTLPTNNRAQIQVCPCSINKTSLYNPSNPAL